MAALAFVLFWVLLGIGLLLVALRGGRSGSAAEAGRRPRRSRRVGGLGFLLALLILGIGVPAAVIATVNNRDSIPAAGVSHLTPFEKRGRDLFGGAAQCKNCHTLAAANTSATVGPNLDQRRPPYNLVLDAIKNGRAAGNGAMAANLAQGEDAEAVAAFVATAVNHPVPPEIANKQP
jgi:mono/diheme cytochrome c family protein